MPRKPDLTWHMKRVIWDLAVKSGKDKYTAVERGLDRLRNLGRLKEDVPDQRKIKDVIAEIESLPVPVLKTLPEHIWLLREDYEQIKDKLAAQTPLSTEHLHLPIRLEKICEKAEELEKQLSLPPPYLAVSWGPDGTTLGVTGLGTDYPRPLNRSGYVWQREDAGPGVLQLTAEKDELWFNQITRNISADQLWESFNEWKAQGADYLWAHQELTEDIVTTCKERTGCNDILSERQWPLEGIYWTFPRTIYQHLVRQAEEPEKIGAPRNAYPEPRQVPQHGVLTQKYINSIIACHRDGTILKNWRAIHDKLLKDCPLLGKARDLTERYLALQALAMGIKGKLQKGRKFLRDRTDRIMHGLED